MTEKCDCGGDLNGDCMHAWCLEAPEVVNLVGKAWLRGFEMNSPKPDDRPLFVWLDGVAHPLHDVLHGIAREKYDQADKACGYSARWDLWDGDENATLADEPEMPQELADLWEEMHAYSNAPRWEISANISGYSTLKIFYFPKTAAAAPQWYCRDSEYVQGKMEYGPMVAIDFQTALFLAENAFFVNRNR